MNPAISDIGNDIIKSRKRGRPASGRVMDGALFRRVPKEHLTTLSELIDEAIVRVTKDKLGLNKTPGEWIESWQRVLDKGGTYPINAGEGIKEIPATGPSQKEFDDLTKWKDQLLLEVAEKDKKLAEFEVRREKWLRASPHEQVLHWISKYDTLVNSIKKNDYDQT